MGGEEGGGSGVGVEGVREVGRIGCHGFGWDREWGRAQGCLLEEDEGEEHVVFGGLKGESR